jgi:hypothetical protein
MVEIPITSHAFEKVNIVTIVRGGKAYDVYRCRVCGLTGKRYGFSETLVVKKDIKNCTAHKIERKVRIAPKYGKYLKGSFGLLPDSEYTTVEPPEEYKGKYPGSVWVFSEQRGEPVRLLVNEYIVVK